MRGGGDRDNVAAVLRSFLVRPPLLGEVFDEVFGGEVFDEVSGEIFVNIRFVTNISGFARISSKVNVSNPRPLSKDAVMEVSPIV